LQLALRLGTCGRFLALPVAFSLLTDWVALRFGSNAFRVTLSRRAYCFTFWAALLLTHIFGASHRAHRALTVDGALGTGCLLAGDLALGTLTHGVAHSRAGRIVALPFTLWMTHCLEGRVHGGR